MANKYPVIFFTYKRYATTGKFLDLMKSAGTKKIYIFADGPQSPDDKSATELVKKNITQFQQDNPSIEVKTFFTPRNLGLKKNIIDGLTDVFRQEEAAIIIEDDCLPHPDFFRYCNELLSRYRTVKKVMSINGTSVCSKTKYSYDFTRYSQCWGWATWARAWNLYDPSLAILDKPVWKMRSREIWRSPLTRWYWNTMLHLVKWGQIDTWDFQWSLTVLLNHGLAVTPKNNLIENIGFGNTATNTKTKSTVANLPTHDLEWPLRHPAIIEDNDAITQESEKKFYINFIAIMGMLRQYYYYEKRRYAHRH